MRLWERIPMKGDRVNMVKGFKKQVFYILAACIVLAMAITSYGENKNYKIIINQKELITSNQPFN